MQQVQLYINEKRVEMSGFEGITITDTIKDVRDVSKVFTEYSQTFKVKASKDNNKIFKHYYNSDIVNGFDSRVRVPANIELNHLPFKRGYIKLEGVDLSNNIPLSYRITFFGETVSLKDLLGDDLLSSLSWLDNFSYKDNGDTLRYTAADIETYLTTDVSRTFDSVTYVNPVQVPLITHSQRLYYDSTVDVNTDGNVHYNSTVGDQYLHGVKWSNLKYSIKLNIIVKAIEKRYTIANGYSQNLVFSNDFFNLFTSNQFNELCMWLHRVAGKVTDGSQVTTYNHAINSFTDTDNNQSFMDNSVLRLKSFGQVDGVNTVLRLNLVAGSVNQTTPYSFIVYKDGLSVYTSGIVEGDVSNINIPVVVGSEYTVQVNTTVSMAFENIYWTYSYYDAESSQTTYETYYTSAISIPQYLDFSITNQIPKMKVLDFLTSIFKMFNLVAYVDGTEITVKTLDSYYADGISHDITKYIDTKSSQVDSVLPFNEILFGYEGLGTFLSKRHNSLFNEEWGTEEYRTDSSTIFTGGSYKYKIPFEHMKFERLLDVSSINPPTTIQWGYCVDDSQNSYLGKPIVMYIARKSADISFAYNIGPDNDNILNVKEIDNYFAPANSNLKFPDFLDRQSINFSPESDEWELTPNRRSLFASYHDNYIAGVFNKLNRLTKIKAFLPLKTLLTYSLKDRFIVSGNSYKINSLETNLHSGKSQIELIGDFAPAVIDLIPPTAPSNLALVGGSQTTSGFSVSWTASTDSIGVTGYIIDLQQEFYTTVLGSVTTYTFTGLTANTDYRVIIFATDAAGNVSLKSNTLDTFTLQ